MSKLRAFQPDWRTWLAASLLPVKIYTVVAVLCLIVWHAFLPANDWSRSTGFDWAWFNAINEFNFIARYIWQGYLLAAFILMLGGLVQLFKCSRKAGLVTIFFGIAAFIIPFVAMSFLCEIPNFTVD